MTNISTATTQQLQQLSDFVVLQRSIVGQWLRTMNQMNALNNSWNSTISAIVGTPNNISVVDNSGFAGSAQLTDTDVFAVIGYMQTCMTDFYDATHQQEMVKFCGPGNSIG